MKMQSFLKALLLISIVNLYGSLCSDGCLMCDQSNQCLLCDYTNSYVLQTNATTNDKSCVIDSTGNCKTYNVLGTCVVCNTNFFLDSATQKCVAVPTPITNCEIYANSTSCSLCQTQFYLSGQNCVTVGTTLIANCQYYNQPQNCKECNSGYMLSYNSQSCVQITTVTNCTHYATFKCDACQANFFTQENYIKAQMEVKAQINSLQGTTEALAVVDVAQDGYEKKCLATSITNCVMYETFSKCLKCSAGFYVSNGICQENPQDPIANCLVYQSLTRCSSCEPMYYLTATHTCQPVIQVQDCISYSSTSFESLCTECSSDFYLEARNLCTLRKNQISQCKTYNLKKDECSVCEASYQTTHDNLKCLVATSNCQIYFNSDENSTELVCLECINGFYIDTNNDQCVQGTVQNCQIYLRSANTCKKCVNQYYLGPNNDCIQHTTIANCDVYDPYQANQCQTCTFNSSLFTVNSQCTSFTIANCSQALNQSSCELCNDGFMLNTQSQCETMPSSLQNCLQASLGVCSKCNDGFILKNNQCFEPYEVFSKNCATLSLDVNNRFEAQQCSICKENFMPYEYQGLKICMNNTKLESITGMTIAGSNCVQYGREQNGTYTCLQCMSGFYKHKDNTCKNTKCSTDAGSMEISVNLQRNQDGTYHFRQTDQCVARANDCLFQGILKKQSATNINPQYDCFQCSDNATLTAPFDLIKIQDDTIVYHNAQGFDYANTTPLHIEAPKVHCAYTNASIINYVADTAVANCRYYYELPHNQFGCMKCKAGFTGQVINWEIKNCQIYDEEKKVCTKCMPKHVLEQNGMECNEKLNTVNDPTYPHIFNCDEFSYDNTKCYKCNPGFGLKKDNTGCVAVAVIPSCEIPDQNYDGVSPSCSKCTDGTLLTDDRKECYNPIPFCRVHLKPDLATAAVCKECYPHYTNSGIACTFLYSPNLQFDFNTQCTAYVAIDNCTSYNLSTPATPICLACDPTRYVLNNKCIEYGKYFDIDVSATTEVTASKLCKKFIVNNAGSTVATGDYYSCLECLDGHYFYPAQVDNTQGNYQCIPDNQVWDGANISPTLIHTSNTVNCVNYDLVNQRCVQCAATHYLQDGEDRCVQLQNAYKKSIDSTILITTIDLPYFTGKFYTNVSKIKTHGDFFISIECNAGSVMTPYKQCCLVTEYFNITTGDCTTLPSNCQDWDYLHNRCKTCNQTANPVYYNTEHQVTCCQEGQFYDLATSACIPITAVNCLRYDDVDNVCLKCEDLYVFKTDKCELIQFHFANCVTIDQSTKQCTSCALNHNLIDGHCCPDGQELVTTAGSTVCQAIAPLITECKKYGKNGANYVCSECNADFFLYESVLVQGYDKCCDVNQATQFQQTDCYSATAPLPDEFKLPNSEFCETYNVGALATFATDSKCVQCQHSPNKNIYQSTDGATFQCCKEETYFDGTACVAVTILNCLQENNAVCAKCKEGFGLNAAGTACVALDNCTNLSAGLPQTCDQCNSDHFTEVTAPPQPCTEYKRNTNYDQMTSCILFDIAAPILTLHPHLGTRLPCTTCRGDSYNLSAAPESSCCPVGYEYNTIRCVKITRKNCATTTTGICTACLLNASQGKTLANYKVKYSSGSRGSGYLFNSNANGTAVTGLTSSVTIASFNTAYQPDYHLSPIAAPTDCCEGGQHFINGKCEDSPIKNCYKYDSATQTCNECYIGFYQANSNRNCCDQLEDYIHNQGCVKKSTMTCQDANNYLSNNRCCQTQFYFNTVSQKCEPLMDPNCLKSDSNNTCNECDAGNNFVLDVNTTIVASFEYDFVNYLSNNDNSRIVFQPCVKKELLENAGIPYTHYKEFSKFMFNCAYVDTDNKSCLKCKKNFNQTSKYPICCPDKTAAREQNGFYHCENIVDLDSNCMSFSWSTRTCSRCQTGFQLSYGVCCPNGKIYNNETNNCDLDVSNCNKIVHDTCQECSPGFYFSNGHCCAMGQYWDITATLTTSGVTNIVPQCKTILISGCDILNDNGQCDTCSTGQYITNGKCCPLKQFWQLSSDSCQDILTTLGASNNMSGFYNCNKLDPHQNCYECDTVDTHFYNGRCCLFGNLWNFDRCAPPTSTTTNCKIYQPLPDQDTAFDANRPPATWSCTECDTGYYLNSSNKCTPNNQIFDGTNNINPFVQVDFCYRFLEGLCKECLPGYSLIQNLGINPTTTSCVLTSTITTINECLVYDMTFQCLICGNQFLTTGADCTTAAANCLRGGTVCHKCMDGFYLDTSNNCQPMPHAQCLEADTAGVCQICKDGHYLFNNGCFRMISTRKPTNCRSASTTFDAVTQVYTDTCLKCEQGMILDPTNVCLSPLTNEPNYIHHCKFMLIAPGPLNKCTECEPGYDLQNDAQLCCPYGYYFDGTNCLRNDKGFIANCIAYGSEGCQTCDTNFYLTRHHCCANNKFWTGKQCSTFITDNFGNKDCEQYNDDLSCKDLSPTASCLNGKYLSSGRCCATGFYFKGLMNGCVAIETDLYPDCEQVSNGQCSQCTAGNYNSNGKCVADTKLYDTITQQVIDIDVTRFPNCNQVSQDKCIGCIAGNNIGDNTATGSNKCCNAAGSFHYYDSEKRSCIQLHSNCNTGVFDYVNNQCTTCNNVADYITGVTCCPLEEYFDGTNCSPISGLTNYAEASECEKITEADFLLQRCTACKTSGGGTLPYAVKDGKCCGSDQINIDNFCTPKTVLSDCLILGDNGSCIKCDSPKELRGYPQQVCCAAGEMFENGACTAATAIANCQTPLNSTVCGVCNTGFYLTSDNTCCDLGHEYDPNGAPQCSTTLSIEGCVAFNASDDCKTCDPTFRLLINNNHKGICCALNEHYDELTNTCQPITAMVNECVSMDLHDLFKIEKRMVCTQCTTATHYLSKGMCCPFLQWYDTTTKTCTATGVVTGCKKMNDDGTCQDCDTQYVSGGQCCSDGEYYDGAACTPTAKNCKHHVNLPNGSADSNTCANCATGKYLTHTGQCCAHGEFDNAGTCTIFLTTYPLDLAMTNCEEFDSNQNCQKCATGFTLAFNKESCCVANDFIVNGDVTLATQDHRKCEATPTVPISCQIFDTLTFKCTKCFLEDVTDPAMKNYYISEPNIGQCCKIGERTNVQTRLCEAIDTNLYPDCIMFDGENDKCSMCATTHFLRDDYTCDMLPPNCISANSDNGKCLQCAATHYLYDEICVTLNYIFDYKNNTEVLLDDAQYNLPNCSKALEDKCIEVNDSATHYLTNHGYSCKYHTYFDAAYTEDSSVTGDENKCNPYPYITACKRYGESKEECLECDPGYILFPMKFNHTICLQLADDLYRGCEEYTYNETTNTLQCIKCDQTPGLMTPEGITAVQANQGFKVINNCQNLKLDTSMTQSIKECALCDTNYFYDHDHLDRCIAKISLPTNCSALDFNDNTLCSSCNDGYYLDEDGKCVINPIEECKIYDFERRLCLECNVDSTATAADVNLHLKLWYEQHGTTPETNIESQCKEVDNRPRTTPSFYAGYIQTCTTDASTPDKIVPVNTDIQIQKFFNKFSCTGANDIPWAFVLAGAKKTSNPFGISQFQLNEANQVPPGKRKELLQDDPNADLQNINECLNKNLTNFSNETGLNAHTLPDNCALGMVNAQMKLTFEESKNDHPNFSKLSAFCVACKSGFAPKRVGSFPLMIYECTAIANCDLSDTTTIINGCAKCNAGHYWTHTDGKIDYTQCAQIDSGNITIANCEVINSNQTCAFCSSGYTVNYDGRCVQIVAPLCQDTSVSILPKFKMSSFPYLSWKQDMNPGCTQCDANYTAYHLEETHHVCSTDPTINPFTALSTSTTYNQNCFQYGLNGNQVGCKVCNTGFLITSDNQCVSSSNLSFCVLAINATDCHTCDATHIVVNKQCVDMTITNCTEYIRNPASTVLTCSKCASGFFLDNNTCVTGSVQNCSVYNAIGKCSKCNDTYALIRLENDEQYCMKVEVHSGCNLFNEVKFNQNIIECQTCDSVNKYVELLSSPSSTCNAIEQISDCVEYDKESLFVFSTLKCKTCNSSFYLSNNQCISRTVIDQNCQTYEANQDACQQCKPTHYLSTDKTSCIIRPGGIAGCVVYLDQSICLQCASQMYLDNNRCLAAQNIANCKVHKNSTQCKICEDTFILDHHHCRTPTVQCATYFSYDECASCSTGLVLKIVNGRSVCGSPDASILNCLTRSQITPYDCITCSSGFYLDTTDKTCKTATTINGCEIYESADTCKKCTSNQILSSDKKTCLQISNSYNCVAFSEEAPFCISCLPGFVLNDQNQCVEDTNGLKEGCMALETNIQKSCIACYPGYFHNTDKQCTKNGNTPVTPT